MEQSLLKHCHCIVTSVAAHLTAGRRRDSHQQNINTSRQLKQRHDDYSAFSNKKAQLSHKSGATFLID